jgi:hypothetical protein
MILYLPFILQGILMGVDERLHYRRGLGLWERLGHPLDSLTVFVPLSFAAMNDFTSDNSKAFIILAAFSCVFVTKDELVHARECSGLEHWLHAVLFLLHPVVFLCTWIIWRDSPLSLFLSLQPVFVGTYMTYQVFKWSFPWTRLRK